MLFNRLKPNNTQQVLIGQKPKKEKKKVVLPYLQRIGKSLLFPIALLPLAAIFLRVSALIPTDADKASEFAIIVQSILSSIGNAVFGPILPVLFAIGVAFGMSNDQRGEAAILGFVSMILLQIFLSLPGEGFAGSGISLVERIYGKLDLVLAGTDINLPDGYSWSPEVNADRLGFSGLLAIPKLNADTKLATLDYSVYTKVMVNNVLNGISVGILVSVIYNTFNKIELPNILGFFSGRRLIPVLVLILGCIFSILWAIIFPWIAWVIYYLSYYMQLAIGSSRWANAGIMAGYGFANRLLIPFGLHHIPNTLFWFGMGYYETDSGNVIVGDIEGFIHGVVNSEKLGFGVNNAGTFQAGFFPFMMFGLPAIALAFKRNAESKEQGKKVAALLYGSAAIAFFTGITEPIEFAFMFISPVLYFIYAILCGICGFIIGSMQIQLGFGFSAGFIDYILSFPKSLELINYKYANGIYNGFDKVMANPGMLIPVGLIMSCVYYWVFKICIVKFKMSAPGRYPNLILDETSQEKTESHNTNENKWTKDAKLIIEGVGQANIDKVDWCSTRLRFNVKNSANINETPIKKSCSRGIVKAGTTGLQIIIGPNVEMLANEIIRLIEHKEITPPTTTNNKITPTATPTNWLSKPKKVIHDIYSPCKGKVNTLASLKDPVFSKNLVGDGLVIDCQDGIIRAPMTGKIVLSTPYKHAYGIMNGTGSAVLIHVGIDTVKLEGKGLKSFVQKDQIVQKGDIIGRFDYNYLKKQGLDHRIIVLITGDSKHQITKKTNAKNVTNNDVILELE